MYVYDLLQRLYAVHQFRNGQYVSQIIKDTVRSQCCIDIRTLSYAEAGSYILAHVATSVLKVSMIRKVQI